VQCHLYQNFKWDGASPKWEMISGIKVHTNVFF